MTKIIETKYESSVLELLNKYIRAVQIEAHTPAMINFMVRESGDKILGKDYVKQRISVKSQKKIHALVLKDMRRRYGHLINIKIKNVKKWLWESNFEYIYKTEFGRLYNNAYLENFFYTTHCLDRWDERVDHDKYKEFSKFFYKKFHTYPTSLDILNFLINLGFQYGIKDNDSSIRFINVNQGCVVIDVWGGELFIAKTFLPHNMFDKDIRWYPRSDPLYRIKDILEPGEKEEEVLLSDNVVDLPFVIWYFTNLI